MAAEGWSDDEVDQLRSVSLHWLRHTSATFDAPLRDMKDLQADLRHNSLSTTQNTYYNSLDEQRAFGEGAENQALISRKSTPRALSSMLFNQHDILPG